MELLSDANDWTCPKCKETFDWLPENDPKMTEAHLLALFMYKIGMLNENDCQVGGPYSTVGCCVKYGCPDKGLPINALDLLKFLLVCILLMFCLKIVSTIFKDHVKHGDVKLYSDSDFNLYETFPHLLNASTGIVPSPSENLPEHKEAFKFCYRPQDGNYSIVRSLFVNYK